MTPAAALRKLGACQERTDAYARFKTMGRAYNHMRRKAMEGDADACGDIWWLTDILATSEGIPRIIGCMLPEPCAACKSRHIICAPIGAQLLPWEIIKHMLPEGLV